MNYLRFNPFQPSRWTPWRLFLAFLSTVCLAGGRSPAAEPKPDAAGYNVTGYAVSGSDLLGTNVLTPLFAKYTGTNVTLKQILLAATDLHYEFCKIGQSAMSVAIARDHLTNGIITLNVFKTDIPQVVISGESYLRFTNAPTGKPASPAEIAIARQALTQTMAELKQREADLKAKAADPRIHVVSTNVGPRFAVSKYLVMGNTVLTPQNISQTLTNIDGAFGTNVSFDGISTAVSELQRAYRERGYVTVAVGVPPQKLTNAEVKLQVTEGRLASISVTGNRYFSSNNVMRALPGLHTNLLLNGPVFQAELNRANANRDRQIYPVIGPGPVPGSSALTLKVKDQLPVHGKLEFNNLSSPGTPDLRVNASAETDNLWQMEHSLGIQYGFSPEQLKAGDNWWFFDRPAVANYSGFYRLPIGDQQPIEDIIAQNPGSFGYNEATRKFNLPPSTGRPELTLYASRSTIDTGSSTVFSTNLLNDSSGNNLNQNTTQHDTTRNMDFGARLSTPIQSSPDFQSTLSGGLDFKIYKLDSAATNIFTGTGYEIDYNTQPPTTNLINLLNYSPLPYTVKKVEYLPLATRYDASWKDWLGIATFGLGLGFNAWYAAHYTTYNTTNGQPAVAKTGRQALTAITGSSDSSGYWVTLTPSFSHSFMLHTNWPLNLRADGQWASEPLINNEQYGIGGVNSVRGYHEGEAFGDAGWHISLEQQTPAHLIGMVNGDAPLTISGSAFMDYGQVFLLDPQGRPDNMQLWGTGVGLTSAIGSHWQSRFLVSVPLIGTTSTPRNEPFFNFILTAQF